MQLWFDLIYQPNVLEIADRGPSCRQYLLTLSWDFILITGLERELPLLVMEIRILNITISKQE